MTKTESLNNFSVQKNLRELNATNLLFLLYAYFNFFIPYMIN
jgi:hypothetical protein